MVEVRPSVSDASIAETMAGSGSSQPAAVAVCAGGSSPAPGATRVVGGIATGVVEVIGGVVSRADAGVEAGTRVVVAVVVDAAVVVVSRELDAGEDSSFAANAPYPTRPITTAATTLTAIRLLRFRTFGSIGGGGSFGPSWIARGLVADVH